MIHFHEDSPNQLLMNPRLPAAEKQALASLCAEFEKLYGPQDYFLIPSSGSSQRAGESVKLVALHRRSVLNSARRFNHYFGAGPQDHWGLVLPEFHVAGLGVKARAFLAGAQVHNREWAAENPEPVLRWIEEQGLRFLSLVPAQAYDLVRAGVRCPGQIKKIFVGAGSLIPDLRRQLRGLSWPVAETYGMTETGSMIAVREAGEEDFRVLPGVELRLDETLQIRCDSLVTATLQRRANGEMEIRHWPAGEWYLTEDLAELPEAAAGGGAPVGAAAYLRPLGRRSEYVKILGEGVSLPELRGRLEAAAAAEGIAARHLALLPLEDVRAGYRLVLAVEDEVPPERQQRFLARYHAEGRPYERISAELRLPRIPRSDLGKLKVEELKSIIRERLKYGEHQ